MSFLQKQKTEGNPFLGLVGFVVMIVVGGISFVIAPRAIDFVTTTQFSFGIVQVLPIQFPSDWPAIMRQLVMTLALFLVFFALLMIPLAAVIKPEIDDKEMEVSIGEMRKKKAEQRKRKYGR